eukprot:3807586-Amphidinium_carterae.1
MLGTTFCCDGRFIMLPVVQCAMRLPASILASHTILPSKRNADLPALLRCGRLSSQRAVSRSARAAQKG